ESDEIDLPKKYSKVELAYFRAEIEYFKTRDPKTGVISPNIREKELDFVKSIPSKDDYRLFDKNYIPVIQSQDWISRGPVNIAGRIKAIAFDILDENIVLAGSASGGLWRSTDGGENWLKTSSPNAEQTVYCIEQDRRSGHTNTWYYGTGELLSTTDRKLEISPRTVGMGNGIYKSTDNGLTWNHLQSTRVLDKGNLTEVFQGIWDINVDTSIKDKDVIYAACHGAVMKSEDGGESWKTAIGDLGNKCFSTDIEISADGLYYCALSTMTDNDYKPLKDGIYRSDDGEIWKDITPQNFPDSTRVVKIKLAPGNQNVLYVLTEAPIPPLDPFFSFASSHHTFWKYTYNPDSGKGEWEDRTANLPDQSLADMNQALSRGLNSLGGYCLTLNVKPDNEDVVFIGGTNIFRSTTGFADSLFRKIGGYYTSLHADQHAIEFLPSNPNIIYNGSDGGVSVCDNAMASTVKWDEKNNGLISTQYYSVAIDKAVSFDELMIGGLQDQGTVMKIDTIKSSWFQIYGGDGLSCFIGNNKDFAIVTIYDGQIYGGLFEGEEGVVLTNKSLLISDEMKNIYYNFYTLFDVEPNLNNELYLVAKNVIYRKKNLKVAINDYKQRNINWTLLSHAALPKTENITAIRLSKEPANRLYFGSDAGKLYRIDDAETANPGYIEITGDEFPQNAYTACITVDPENADNLFVIFSNYNVQSIFYSTDGGATWSAQGGNLEENPDGGGAGPSIRWIEILHTEEGTIYFAGTSAGLYSTTALAGVNIIWLKESDDLIGNIKVDMITARQSDGFVAVATQGNGIYSAYVDNIISVKNQSDFTDFLICNYPNPCRNHTTFNITLPADGAYSLSLYDINGKLVNHISERYYRKGIHRLNYNTSGLHTGKYFYVLSNGRLQISGNMIVE
ncbi:T9SS type A sorting domain-containing protein, partial [Bacteroidota bacterium]